MKVTKGYFVQTSITPEKIIKEAGKRAPPGMSYICCNENKNENISKKEPQVSEGVQDRDSVRKIQNEVILAKREKENTPYFL